MCGKRSTPAAGPTVPSRVQGHGPSVQGRPRVRAPNASAEGAEIPELQEEYQGEVPPHILWGEDVAPESAVRPPLEERIAQAFDSLDMDQDV